MLPIQMSETRSPHYPLEDVKSAIRDGRYWITRRAGLDAAHGYLDEEDIRDCVLRLEECHFFKTMSSKKRPGLNQDVYRCRYAGIPIYTKLQIGHEDRAVVISFKRDERA